ncbi:MAG: type II secretion system protein [Acidimicrobiales bacterium]
MRERAIRGIRVGAHAGCTLVEIMVVLLLPAILLAVAIRTFLSVTNSANHRATRSDLDTALIAGRSIYSTQSLT